MKTRLAERQAANDAAAQREAAAEAAQAASSAREAELDKREAQIAGEQSKVRLRALDYSLSSLAASRNIRCFGPKI